MEDPRCASLCEQATFINNVCVSVCQSAHKCSDVCRVVDSFEFVAVYSSIMHLDISIYFSESQ